MTKFGIVVFSLLAFITCHAANADAPLTDPFGHPLGSSRFDLEYRRSVGDRCENSVGANNEPIIACVDAGGMYRVFHTDPDYAKHAKEKREEAARQERAAAEEKKKAEAQAEAQAQAQSPLLREVNSKYPGLADRETPVVIPNTNPAEPERLGKFLLCIEQKKDAADWNVTRDRGGVHLTGLLYEQSAALDFVDHGSYLEIVGATYGDRVSLNKTDALGVLDEIARRCNN